MRAQDLLLSTYEKVSFSLRALYSQYGYTQYKMSKFEEYDLYARNKDFLISDKVITFTDLSGKLMALKPDVTLSIVKNSIDEPDSLQKLYYAENVYRATKGAYAYKEIMQVGLECMGNVDDYCLCEVLTLAAKSILTISDKALLNISNLSFLSDLIDGIGIVGRDKTQVIRYIGQKNYHELSALCRGLNIEEEKISKFLQILTTTGEPETVLPEVCRLASDIVDVTPVKQLLRVIQAIGDDAVKSIIQVDFSVVDDLHYYNGLVFKGFVQGLPQSVLSGGQYNKLMRKMNRRSNAIGFAVYMDMLERLNVGKESYDVDVVLMYEDGASPAELRRCVDKLIAEGNRVMAQQKIPHNIRYRQLMKYADGEVLTLE